MEHNFSSKSMIFLSRDAEQIFSPQILLARKLKKKKQALLLFLHEDVCNENNFRTILLNFRKFIHFQIPFPRNLGKRIIPSWKSFARTKINHVPPFFSKNRMLLIGPIGGCGHFARDLLLSRVVSRTLLRNTERGARGRCLKRLRIAVLVFHPFPCSWYASTLLPPEIVYPFSCVPTRYGRVVNDIMESRSTSPHPPAPLLLLHHVGPPRPTVVNVTSPTTLLFFSRSLTPPFLRIGIRLLLAPAFVLHRYFYCVR